MTENTIGVDISKDVLDVHRQLTGEKRRFANTQAGHRALINWIGDASARVVFEPTGPYHAAFEKALSGAGLAMVKVNPRQARRFAQAIGQLAKTDRLDAALLAHMGAVLKIAPRPVKSQALRDLKELIIAREALIKDRTAAKNRAKHLTLSEPIKQTKRRLKQIEQDLKALEDRDQTPQSMPIRP